LIWFGLAVIESAKDRGEQKLLCLKVVKANQKPIGLLRRFPLENRQTRVAR
jgi:hypothetical protein